MMLVGLVALLAVSVQAIIMPYPLTGQKELVRLSFLDSHSQASRFRRSDVEEFQFPEILIFNVTVSNVTTTLTLQLSHVNNGRPPVYVYDENGDIVRKDFDNRKRTALYQDFNSGASYMVTCAGPDPEQCSLHGSFYQRQNKYFMTTDKNFATSGLHEVTLLAEEPINHGNDGIEPPEHIQNVNRKPEKIAEESGRPKRSLPNANIVEQLVVVDESVWKAFRAEANSATLAEEAIRDHYSVIINEVDLHFLSVPMVDSSLHIRVALAGVFIAKNGNQAPWSRDNTVRLNGKDYLKTNGALDSFTTWRNSIRSKFDSHDHAMAFTM